MEFKLKIEIKLNKIKKIYFASPACGYCPPPKCYKYFTVYYFFFAALKRPHAVFFSFLIKSKSSRYFQLFLQIINFQGKAYYCVFLYALWTKIKSLITFYLKSAWRWSIFQHSQWCKSISTQVVRGLKSHRSIINTLRPYRQSEGLWAALKQIWFCKQFWHFNCKRFLVALSALSRGMICAVTSLYTYILYKQIKTKMCKSAIF